MSWLVAIAVLVLLIAWGGMGALKRERRKREDNTTYPLF